MLKVGRWIIALIITLVVILNYFSLSNKVARLQFQINDISSKAGNIAVAEPEPQETCSDIILQIKAEVAEVAAMTENLEEKVQQYEQDIYFWNEQVDNMFGVHNARYFREGRGK